MEKQSILYSEKGSDKSNIRRMRPQSITAVENRKRTMCEELIKRLVEKNFKPEERIQ